MNLQFMDIIPSLNLKRSSMKRESGRKRERKRGKKVIKKENESAKKKKKGKRATL